MEYTTEFIELLQTGWFASMLSHVDDEPIQFGRSIWNAGDKWMRKKEREKERGKRWEMDVDGDADGNHGRVAEASGPLHPSQETT